jgi:hypothetical protein
MEGGKPEKEAMDLETGPANLHDLGNASDFSRLTVNT